jgi:WD40 repeat protein
MQNNEPILLALSSLMQSLRNLHSPQEITETLRQHRATQTWPKEWLAFLRQHSHLLLRGGHVALLQAALSYGESSLITQAAKAFFATGNFHKPFLQNLKTPATPRETLCVSTFVGHSEALSSISVCNEHLLSTSFDHTARIYDLSDGLPKFTLEHNEPVLCGDISPKFAATGTKSGAVHLWSLATGACERVIKGHATDVVLIAFYRGVLLTASKDNKIKLWDLETGECLETIGGFSGDCQAFLSHEQERVYYSQNSTITSLHLGNKSYQTFQRDDNDQLMWFAFGGELLLASFAEVSNSPSPPFQWISAFDLKTGQEKNADRTKESSLVLSPDGKRSVSWDDYHATFCNEETRQDTNLGVFPERVRCVAFGAQDQLFVGGDKGTIWALDLTIQATTPPQGEGSAKHLFFTQDGNTLVSSGGYKTNIWNANTGESLRGLSSGIYSEYGVLTKDQKTVAMIGSKEIVCVDLETGSIKQKFSIAKSDWFYIPEHYLASPDRLLAFHKEPKSESLRVIALPSLEVLSEANKEIAKPYRAAFLSDDNFAIVTAKEPAFTPLLLNLKTGEIERKFTGHTSRPITLLPLPGGRFLSVGQDATMLLSDYRQEEALFRAEESVQNIAISPDGRSALSFGPSLSLWNLEQPAKPQTFLGYTKSIVSAAFFPDGKSFITGDHDKALLLWEVGRETPVARFEAPGVVVSCAVSSVGIIACVTSNGVIFLKLER